MSEQNNVISPDDLSYNQSDPVTYSSISWEKVTTSPGLDRDRGVDAQTISSSGGASTETDQDDSQAGDEELPDVSLKPEYNTGPETLLTAIRDIELDDGNMTESSVFSSSSDSDYYENYYPNLTINGDYYYYDFVTQVTPEEENEADEEVDEEIEEYDVEEEFENEFEVAGAVMTTLWPDTDQTNADSQLPTGEEVSDAVTPWPGSDVTSEGEQHNHQEAGQAQPGVIDGGDYPQYSLPSDDNNEKDETSQQDNSSLVQFANIFSLDESQEYQDNETDSTAAPPPHPPLLSLMQKEPRRLRFLIQPHRHLPDTKVRLEWALGTCPGLMSKKLSGGV